MESNKVEALTVDAIPPESFRRYQASFRRGVESFDLLIIPAECHVREGTVCGTNLCQPHNDTPVAAARWIHRIKTGFAAEDGPFAE
jgi:hypothetical protein